jgi:glycosyltransferase involved in cell wall biosynthesis
VTDGRPEVSVVVPTRARPGRLAEPVRSALGQTGVSLELIVVADGAGDETRALLEPLTDPRIRVVELSEAPGVAAARNAGIAAARASLIAFLDDDDLWAPTKLLSQVRVLADTGAGFSYTGALVVDDQLDVLAELTPPDGDGLLARLLQRNVIPNGTSSVVATRRTLESVGGFDERLGFLSDWDLWIRLAAASGAAPTPASLVAYVQHPDTWTHTRISDALDDFELLQVKHGLGFDRVDFARYVSVALRRSGQPRKAAGHYLRSGVAERNPGNLIRAIGALLGERPAQYLNRRAEARPVRPAWLDELR